MQQVAAYRYMIDGRPAAGMLASDIPEAYTQRLRDGTLCVDYNSLIAELWAAVRGLCQRVAECERRIDGR